MQKFLLLLFVVSSFTLVGCASSEESKTSDNKVSTIPWNRPQRWEGQGMIGGMMNQ